MSKTLKKAKEKNNFSKIEGRKTDKIEEDKEEEDEEEETEKAEEEEEEEEALEQQEEEEEEKINKSRLVNMFLSFIFYD